MGTYRVASPQGDGPHPAVMFLHGAGGTGAGVLGMGDPIARLTHRGYVVLAPDGLPWRPGRTGGIWNFRSDLPREWPRDEAAFLAEVVADATARHAVDSARIVLSGFSAGAFMVNYLACATPDAFAAYAPVSGGFWRPHPEACAGPVRLLHTHGWRDSTVPLEGRPLRDGAWLQGDVFEGLGLWRTANSCSSPAPTGYAATGPFLRRSWACMEGSALELAMFPGGHTVPSGWADMMVDWFEELPPG
jgi:polyhydroxybutyrate depolymerase